MHVFILPENALILKFIAKVILRARKEISHPWPRPWHPKRVYHQKPLKTTMFCSLFETYLSMCQLFNILYVMTDKKYQTSNSHRY